MLPVVSYRAKRKQSAKKSEKKLAKRKKQNLEPPSTNFESLRVWSSLNWVSKFKHFRTPRPNGNRPRTATLPAETFY